MPRVALNGVELYYEESGSGFPVVFCHEFAGDYRAWDPQVRAFNRLYRCITYSQRGFPPSSVPDDLESYSQQLLIADLRALVDHLGIQQAHFVGFSMGGSVVLNFALQYPERCRSIVVAGTGSGATDRARFENDIQRVVHLIRNKGISAFADAYAEGPTRHQFKRKDPHGWSVFRGQLAEHAADGQAFSMLGVMLRRPTIFSLEDQLRGLQVPTLIAIGDEDEPCVDVAVFLKRTLPSSGLLVLPQSGHTINLEEPALFNAELLEFLRLVEAGRWAHRSAVATSMLPVGAPRARVAEVVEEIHGVPVADPYRWLEDGDSPETKAWVDAQNRFSRQTLDALPQRAPIHARLDQLLTTGAVSAPALRAARSFYQRRSGRADQPVLVMRGGANGEERPIIDPNTLSATGTVALDWWYPSRGGKLLAYGLSEGGTELSTLRVLDIERGEELEADRIPHTRAASLAWLPDDSGFYYTRYPVPGSVAAGEEVYHRHVYFHVLGQDWHQDEEVFGAGRPREDWPNVELSYSGRWLIVEVEQGWVRSEVYALDREHPDGGFVPIHTVEDALAHAVFAGDRLLIHTNAGAPNYALYEVDPQRPERDNWRTILPERQDRVLEHVHAAAGRLVVHQLHKASSQADLFGLDGDHQSEIHLPSIGTLTGIGGEWDASRIAVGFTSFAQPPSAYTVNAESGEIRLFAEGELPPGLDPSRYVVRQDWYQSRDGTRVSIFLVHRRDLPPTGDRPTVLTGYGGFNVSRTPSFVAALPLWLDAGGMYALTNLRGGGEYGEAWHRAGMLGQKQNVFDDFIAAAEWLIASGYTRPERLAISGGSNGGLLVGAALTQRPDLFKAAICQVPLLDMLRFQHLRIARLWIPEYGSAEVAEQFRWLYAYSPYHHVRDGERYPATFLLTAEGDSRVDPMHARKMAARLQAATSSDAPILLRVETAAGHGQGKPRSKQLDEATDIWSFLFWQLGVSLEV